jgi:hypothetical protein
MRLPQLTTSQRNALALTGNAAAAGLQIFNTDTKCVETWNGAKWIEQCMDCSGYSAPVVSGMSVSKAGNSITFTATVTTSDNLSYTWQRSSDGGSTWTDVTGKGSTNTITFSTTGEYLVKASIDGCTGKVSNEFPVQVVNNISALGETYITALNNVIYSYQYIKLKAFSLSGTIFGYQWYIKYAGYAEQGAELATRPDVSEATPIPGANQSNKSSNMENGNQFILTFDPTNLADPVKSFGYEGAGTYYLYLSVFGKASDGTTDVVKTDCILIRVEDLYDESDTPQIVDAATWQSGHVYFMPLANGLKIAHANLGALETRDSGVLGDLYQWARNEDGHERRRHEGVWYVSPNLNGKPSDISQDIATQVSSGQAAQVSEHYGKFIAGPFTSNRGNWTKTQYSSWGVSGTTDPCTSRNSEWRIPSGGATLSTSDWMKLVIGKNGANAWIDKKITGLNSASDLYFYPWGGLYGTASGFMSYAPGSTTAVSTTEIPGVSGKRYVAIFPSAGMRSGQAGSGLGYIGCRSEYWSSTFYDKETDVNYKNSYAYVAYFYTGALSIVGYSEKYNGYSIRCVKNN